MNFIYINVKIFIYKYFQDSVKKVGNLISAVPDRISSVLLRRDNDGDDLNQMLSPLAGQ